MKNIEILKSKKIIDYKYAINYMEEKLLSVKNNTTNTNKKEDPFKTVC